MRIKGECLCGQVSFTVDGKVSELYKCHCSKCRKFTGTSNSVMFATAIKNLSWQSGQDTITQYTAPSGFHGAFCSVCGSPVPKTRWDKIYLVPAGLLADAPAFSKSVHLHTLSKASWDEITDNYPQYGNDIPADG